MDLKYNWLKQHLESKVIALHYLSTNDMIADFFATFRAMRRIIMGMYYVQST